MVDRNLDSLHPPHQLLLGLRTNQERGLTVLILPASVYLYGVGKHTDRKEGN